VPIEAEQIFIMGQDCLTLQRYGKYYLVNRLATGGSAEPWLACRYINKKFQNFCVVKRVVFREPVDGCMEEKFLKEGQLNFLLRHPSIVTCTDFDRFKTKGENTVFIVMDYVFGKNLAQIQRGHKKNSEKWIGRAFVFQIICSIACAVDYMHRFRDPYTLEPIPIIHRDISPANIMISYAGEVKILDFGIAIQQNDDALPEKTAGKITYMSPEQLSGEELSPLSDLYSLGVIFWELLCGKKLFEKKSDQERQVIGSQDKIIHPSQVNPEVDEKLGDICMKCLEHNPEDRFAQVSEFYDSLSVWMTYTDCFKRNRVQEYMLKYYSDDLKEERKFLGIIQQSPPDNSIFFNKDRRHEEEKPSSIKNDDITLTAEDYSLAGTDPEYRKTIETDTTLSFSSEKTRTITL